MCGDNSPRLWGRVVLEAAQSVVYEARRMTLDLPCRDWRNPVILYSVGEALLPKGKWRWRQIGGLFFEGPY